MTVRELINMLIDVQNKDVPVGIEHIIQTQTESGTEVIFAKLDVINIIAGNKELTIKTQDSSPDAI